MLDLYDDPITVLYSPMALPALPPSEPTRLVAERLSDRLALRLVAQVGDRKSVV